MPSKNATIHDVATLSGVSIGTVSAVLNRKGTVSEGTRRRVLDAISELHYRPSAAARRRLQPTTAKSVGLIVKEVNNPYFADVIFGVQDAARELGYHVLVGHTERSYDLEQRLTELLVAKDVDGLIINPLLNEDTDLSHLFEIRWTNVPLVLIESIRGIQANMVDVDNVAAAMEAVDYLVGLGHRRIVHFGGPQYSGHSEERIEGVRRAFIAHRLVMGEDDVVHAGASLEDGYRAALGYFRDREGDRPTAITCYNDLVAIGVLRALRELGLRVPEDVSVVGFDDIDVASYLSVPLTTVRMPRREIGRRATQMLIGSVEAAGKVAPEKVVLETELVVRASTAPPA
ncbi:LacI family DNA-binding transcriptional regulator [Rubrivirga marina]|uniref:LacI family transcriptional regulator n=1 Tax=Rubrivirga marina TaxID=1196024 RepID=A0A271IV60_9BACT|nr:LacI family DNA-binding transcriptional regulator [Rubrivirga marina]PAP75007.1 LacI family transcriptional regulator [Rubrivirga marina]